MGFIYSQLFVTPAYPTQSFAGQTVIITGSNVGLGKEAARHIARLGASKLILAVRNISSGEAAKKDIESTTKCPSSVVEIWPLDLASFDSVKHFADRASKLPRLDVLLENAGIFTNDFGLAEGHERTVTINVISTFLLAMMLLPKLKSTARDFNTEPRITIVSSETHSWTSFEERREPKIFEGLSDDVKGRNNMSARYAITKLLEILAVRHIAPKLTGSGVIVNTINPGLCHSELARDTMIGFTLLKFFFARSTEVGSRTLVGAAAAGQESHGQHLHDGKVDESALSPFVRSEEGAETAKRVWDELEVILERIQPGVTDSL